MRSSSPHVEQPKDLVLTHTESLQEAGQGTEPPASQLLILQHEKALLTAKAAGSLKYDNPTKLSVWGWQRANTPQYQFPLLRFLPTGKYGHRTSDILPLKNTGANLCLPGI